LVFLRTTNVGRRAEQDRVEKNKKPRRQGEGGEEEERDEVPGQNSD
jgi:hypothetical protein